MLWFLVSFPEVARAGWARNLMQNGLRDYSVLAHAVARIEEVCFTTLFTNKMYRTFALRGVLEKANRKRALAVARINIVGPGCVPSRKISEAQEQGNWMGGVGVSDFELQWEGGF